MISAPEKKWVGWFIVGVVVFTTIPYALGYYLQGDEWRFSGFVFGVEDGNSYIAKMLSGSEGEWLFRTPYTAFEQKGVLAFLPYILLGKLASPPGRHEQLVALFHLFRWAAIALYAFSAYELISLFIKKINLRRAALILIFFGGGLGFLSVFGVKAAGWDGLPLEFYSPESFGFLAVFGLPHIAAGRAFLLWGLIQFMGRRETDNVFRRAMATGLFWTALGLMQPLTVVVAWVILVVGLAIESLIFLLDRRRGYKEAFDSKEFRKTIRAAVLAMVFSAPIPIYTFVAFQIDPYLKGWAAQNLILSPPPQDYLLAYGLILPFAVAGAVRVFQARVQGGAFFVGWLALLPFLAYAPYPLQRRLPEGIWVCLVILAVLVGEMNSPGSFWRRWQPVIYLGILSTLVFIAGGLIMLSAPGRPQYVRSAEVEAYQFLETQIKTNFPVVLADYDHSNALPAWAAVRVMIGHGPESVHLAELQPQVDALLQGNLSEAGTFALLTSQRVDFVLAAPETGGSLSAWYPFLVNIYDHEGYRIYHVDRSNQD